MVQSGYLSLAQNQKSSTSQKPIKLEIFPVFFPHYDK